MSGDTPDYLHKGKAINVRLLAGYDLDQFSVVVNDLETMAHIARYFDGRTVWTGDQVRERLERLMRATRDGSRLTFVVTEPESDLMWGHFDLQRLDEVPGEGEYGIILHRRLWGTGAAAEAFLVGLDYGFTELGLKRIWAQTACENTRMQAFFDKVGFACLGDTGDGHVKYELMAADWPSSRALLEARLERDLARGA